MITKENKMKHHFTVFGERMTQEEVASLEKRVALAIEYEKSLNDEQKAILTDYSDVEEFLREID